MTPVASVVVLWHAIKFRPCRRFVEALTRCCRVPFDALLNEATPISSYSDRARLLHTSAERGRGGQIVPVWAVLIQGKWSRPAVTSWFAPELLQSSVWLVIVQFVAQNVLLEGTWPGNRRASGFNFAQGSDWQDKTRPLHATPWKWLGLGVWAPKRLGLVLCNRHATHQLKGQSDFIFHLKWNVYSLTYWWGILCVSPNLEYRFYSCVYKHKK